ncbi:MAG: peptidylprolyl isomerase [Gammaproteobacteria bacterium]
MIRTAPGSVNASQARCGAPPRLRRKALLCTMAAFLRPPDTDFDDGDGASTHSWSLLMTCVRLETTLGDITLELNQEAAPETTRNFLDYVESGYYAGTIFHRVINGFMIQGGGMDRDMRQKETKDPIKNEANNGLSNDTGTVAMARTSDPHSASAQFFINVKDNAFLNHTSETSSGWGYCVFGKVVDGMDTVKAIKGVATGSHGPHQDVPSEPMEIVQASVVTD